MKDKQEELTARHGEMMGWIWKEKTSPFSRNKLFALPHVLAPCISNKENNVPKISVNCKAFIECFRMYLDKKIVGHG